MTESWNGVCPFCGKPASVNPSEIVALPEQLYHVLCPECGDFAILTSLIHQSGEPSEKLRSLGHDKLNINSIRAENKKAQQDGIWALWIGDSEQLIPWKRAVEKLSEEEGYTRYHVFPVSYHLKD